VGRLFPPLDSAWAFGAGCYSPNYLENLAHFSQLIAGFPGAHAVLTRLLPVKLTQNQVWQQALRIGRDLEARREAEVVKMLQGQAPTPPANPPDLLVVGTDGGRFQDRSRPVGDRWCEYKAAVVYRVTRTERQRQGVGADPQPAPCWGYVAGPEGFARQAAGRKQYADPEPELKTFTATTQTVEHFPALVELEAKRRGLAQAGTVAFVGDGGDFVWRTAREVSEERRKAGRETFEILDLIHASEHLVEAAKAAHGVTPAGARWLTARLGQLWRGEVTQLLAALETQAAAHGPRGAGEPAHTVWTARDYFAEHRERIRYDVFRRHGLPLTSAHMESGIKQTNHRVKGSEKQWLLKNAEAMLALRTLALSQDARWDRYFDALRAGEIRLPTPGRQACPPGPPPPARPTRQPARARRAASTRQRSSKTTRKTTRAA